MRVDPTHATNRAALRRRLGTWVLRDATRAYGAGLALALLPLVYLAREWPPWEIRDALHALPDLTRASVLAAAHAIYGVATLPVVRQLLASERLRWWWTLPLPARWWRGLHLRHLMVLDGPWLGAIVYGCGSRTQTDGPVAASTSALAFIGLTLAGQIALVSVTDRSRRFIVGGVAAWSLAVALAVLLPGPVALALATLALLPAVGRLGRPLPEASIRARGLAGGPPVLALARLGWLAARRRGGVVLVWGAAVQLAAVALVALGLARIGPVEPEAVAALRRGLAVVCATVGAALVLCSARILHGDRPLLDTWGIEPRHERRARVGLAALGVVPALLLGALALSWMGPIGRPWVLDLTLATTWAALGTTRITFCLEARRKLHEPRLLHHLPRLGLALILVTVADGTWALVPWAALEAWRLPRAQRRADRARLRFETARRDDHQG